MMGDVKIPLSPAGAAGAASASAQTPVALCGALEWVHIDYGSAIPATAVVVLEEANSPGQVILSRASNTDGFFYPRHVVHTTAGASAAAVGQERFNVRGQLKATVTLADAQANGVVVTAYLVD